MSYYSNDYSDTKSRSSVNSYSNNSPVSPTYQSNIFGSGQKYSSPHSERAALKAGRFKPDRHVGIHPEAQEEAYFSEKYKRDALKEELRADYQNFLSNSEKKRKEELSAKKGDVKELRKSEQQLNDQVRNIKEAKVMQSHEKQAYNRMITEQMEEDRRRKQMEREKERQEEIKAMRPLFEPNYKKRDINIHDTLNQQVNEKERKKEYEKVLKEVEREQVIESRKDDEAKIRETYAKKQLDKQDFMRKTQEQVTAKVAKDRIQSQKAKEEEKKRIRELEEASARKEREEKAKKMEQIKKYSSDLAVQRKELNENRQKERQERISAPSGHLSARDATNLETDAIEVAYRNKQLEKKNFAHQLQEHLVMKQVYTQEAKERDNAIKEEGFHFSNYKGYDKEKVKKELALQLQEKEAQRERERQEKLEEQRKTDRLRQQYLEGMEKIANEKNLKKQYELKNVQEGLVTKQVLKEDKHNSELESARRELTKTEEKRQRLMDEYEQKKQVLKKQFNSP